jgi:hypothetical protein
VHYVSVRRTSDSGGRSVHSALPAWEEAVVHLAGPAAGLYVDAQPTEAQRAFAAWSLGVDDHHDLPRAESLAAEHGFSVDEATEEACRLVLKHWGAVEATGRALRGSRRGIVSGERVAEIVARSPVRRPAHSSAQQPPPGPATQHEPSRRS